MLFRLSWSIPDCPHHLTLPHCFGIPCAYVTQTILEYPGLSSSPDFTPLFWYPVCLCYSDYPGVSRIVLITRCLGIPCAYVTQTILNYCIHQLALRHHLGFSSNHPRLSISALNTVSLHYPMVFAKCDYEHHRYICKREMLIHVLCYPGVV